MDRQKHKNEIEKVIRNDQFWSENMEKKLLSFYNKCLLPEIVDSRKARSLKLRDEKF